MLLTFNKILATYYASRPIHSLANYTNIEEKLPPVALFDPCSAKIDKVIDRFTYFLPIEVLGREA